MEIPACGRRDVPRLGCRSVTDLVLSRLSVRNLVVIVNAAVTLDASVPKPLFQTRASGPLGLGVRFN
jgi:hypothetical protein